MKVIEELLGERYRFHEGSGMSALTQAQKEAGRLFLEKIYKNGGYAALTACPYCGYDGIFKKISEVDRRGLPADMVICGMCDGCFKLDVLTPDANKFYYENISYLLRGKDVDKAAIDANFYFRAKKFAYPRYGFISHFLKLEPGHDLIVEFGCNDGMNLLPWKEAGFDILGIDMDPRVVEFGRGKGLNLVRGDFMDYDLSKRRPALIILSHLLEHVTDLNAVLKRLREIVRPDGYIFIESPGIRVHGLRNTLAYFDLEHNYNFDLKAMEEALKRHHFRTVYADEYIRAICTPRENTTVSVCGKARSSVNKVFKDGKLQDLLKKGERNSFGSILMSKMQTLYFRLYYSSFAPRDLETTEARGR